MGRIVRKYCETIRTQGEARNAQGEQEENEENTRRKHRKINQQQGYNNKDTSLNKEATMITPGAQ